MAPMTYHVDYITKTTEKEEIIHICTYKWTSLAYSYYTIFTGTVTQFIPLVTILAAYTLIWYELKKTNPDLQLSNNSTQIKRRRLQVFKIQKKFMYIVGAFFTLTLPFSVHIIFTSN